MREFVEKLIDKLGDEYLSQDMRDWNNAILRAVEIVYELAEGFNQGWIPSSERLPETDNYILLSFENYIVPLVGRYEENENGGAFYVGDDEESCVSKGVFVNAWQPLPAPYLANTLQNLVTVQKKIPTNHYTERFNRVV